MRVLTAFALACVIAFWGGLGCTKHSELPTDVLILSNGSEPKDLDPAMTTGLPEHHIEMNLFEGLVGWEPKTLKPIGAVAESWTVSKDKLTYTFKLRKDAKWSNGDPVTAKDFVYSWTRLLKPETAAEYAYQAYYLKNGKAFNKGTLKDEKQLGFKATDDHTLIVTLEAPIPFFLHLLCTHCLYPVHRATVEKYGRAWTKAGNMVSNGAYVLDKWEINKIIVLKKSAYFWDKDKVRIAEAHFLPIENGDTGERMFRAKKIHYAYEVPLEKIPYWQNDKSGSYQQNPYIGSYFFWYNLKRKPFDNKLVRQALNLAIDREQIVKFVTKAGQIPGETLVPPGIGGFVPRGNWPKDLSRVDRAKELLAQAGYPDGKGFPKNVEVLYNTHEGHKKIAEAIQQMWKTNLGIDVKLHNEEWKVYLDTKTNHNFWIARQGWIADYNDAMSFYDLLVTGSGNNECFFSNAKYDSLIAQSSRELDPTRRFSLYQQIEDILYEEAPVIPVYIYTRVYLKSPMLKGWEPNIQDIHQLRHAWLEKEG